MAPNAAIQVYYLKNQSVSKSTWTALGRLVNQAVKNGAGAISMSFGTCGPTSGYTATSSALAAATRKGVGAFVSSGDSGALPGPKKQCGSATGVSYPASDPSVVAVGGNLSAGVERRDHAHRAGLEIERCRTGRTTSAAGVADGPDARGG